ncbi:hypothetical protein [Ottowia thiooxydans]|uniref:Lipoprotein n=1 Tax=Ottowia thiooxydans TaxID=219182 RepID=A0ABV2QIS2_9BURK
MLEILGAKRGHRMALACCLVVAGCGGGGSDSSSPSLADYTLYGRGASVARSAVSGEIPSSGIFRKLPDGAETTDILMHCVSAASTVGSQAPVQQSVSAGVRTTKASVIGNFNALVTASAGKTFFYAENCNYLAANGEPLTPPLGASAISMVVNDKGSHILSGPSNTPSEVDAVLSPRGMVVKEGPTIHWFAYQVGSAVVIVNTTHHSTSAVPASDRVGAWIAP